MNDENNEQNLPVTLRRREDQGTVEIGVTVEGAFVPLQALKIGHLDKLVQLARDRAEQEQQPEQPQ